MIHRIYSSLRTFKELRFQPGLNILLADKTESSTAKQTRNSAGKSSVLEIVHFLTAGEYTDETIFRAPELIDSRFGMEFDLGGRGSPWSARGRRQTKSSSRLAIRLAGLCSRRRHPMPAKESFLPRSGL